MFAVLKTGGKQYRVSSGDMLRVEKLAADAGEKVQFNEILMVGANVGTPTIAGAAVQAGVIDQIKGEKVIHFVKRRRKHVGKRRRAQGPKSGRRDQIETADGRARIPGHDFGSKLMSVSIDGRSVYFNGRLRRPGGGQPGHAGAAEIGGIE